MINSDEISVKQGFLTLWLSIFLLSFSGLFSKFIPIPASVITLYRCLCGVLALALYFVVIKRRIKISSKRHFLGLVILGGLMSLHWVSYYHAIQISTVAVGMISISTYPVITACLEPAIMKEPFKYVDLLLTLLVLFGLSLIVPDFNLSNRVTQGVFWGVVSAVLLSIRNIYSRKMIKHYSGDQLMFYQLLFGFIILTPVLGLYPVTLRVQDWGLLLLLGSVFTALGHSLWLSSLRVINAKTAGLMSCFAPVIGISFAFLLLGEVPEKRTLFGCIIILTGIFLESYWLFRKKASSR